MKQPDSNALGLEDNAGSGHEITPPSHRRKRGRPTIGTHRLTPAERQARRRRKRRRLSEQSVNGDPQALAALVVGRPELGINVRHKRGSKQRDGDVKAQKTNQKLRLFEAKFGCEVLERIDMPGAWVVVLVQDQAGTKRLGAFTHNKSLLMHGIQDPEAELARYRARLSLPPALRRVSDYKVDAKRVITAVSEHERRLLIDELPIRDELGFVLTVGLALSLQIGIEALERRCRVDDINHVIEHTNNPAVPVKDLGVAEDVLAKMLRGEVEYMAHNLTPRGQRYKIKSIDDRLDLVFGCLERAQELGLLPEGLKLQRMRRSINALVDEWIDCFDADGFYPALEVDEIEALLELAAADSREVLNFVALSLALGLRPAEVRRLIEEHREGNRLDYNHRVLIVYKTERVGAAANTRGARKRRKSRGPKQRALVNPRMPIVARILFTEPRAVPDAFFDNRAETWGDLAKNAGIMLPKRLEGAALDIFERTLRATMATHQCFVTANEDVVPGAVLSTNQIAFKMAKFDVASMFDHYVEFLSGTKGKKPANYYGMRTWSLPDKDDPGVMHAITDLESLYDAWLLKTYLRICKKHWPDDVDRMHRRACEEFTREVYPDDAAEDSVGF